MTSPAPQISVIVPVYNVQAHIRACIVNLRRQSFVDFEAIVIDDGSTDDSLPLLRAAIGDDARFTVLRQNHLGLSAARNLGLHTAKARFIAFLDGDDRYAPTYLEKLHTALCNSRADWVACGMRNINPGLRRNTTHSTIHDTPPLSNDRTPRLWPLSTWDETIAHFPSAWNKLYRRELIDGLQFDTGLWFEDHAFFLRAAARSDALLHLPEPLYLQTRGRAGQITTSDSDRVFDQFTVLDTLAGLMTDDAKSGGTTALPRLAHRLLHERSTALHTPERRARFVAAARDWLARHEITAEPGPDIPQDWARELAGALASPTRSGPGLPAALRERIRSPLRRLKRAWYDPAEDTALYAALAKVAQTLHDRLDVPDDVLDGLSLPPTRMLPLFYATLSEPFCQRDAFDLLYDHARHHLQTTRLTPSRDVWFNSGLLPFLLRDGQINLLQAQLRQLIDASDRWLMTAPLAWTIRAGIGDATLSNKTRDALIRSYLAFLDRQAPDYWARTPCLALIDTAVALIAAGPMLPPALWDKTQATLIRAYGLRPEFWERVAATQTALPLRLVAVRQDFEHLRSAPQTNPDALTQLDRAGCPDVIRFRNIWQNEGSLRLLSPPDRQDQARAATVAVVACMRNEMFMLPHFLAHYRKLGVGSFLIADNDSNDGTRAYLAKQPDVCLFSTKTGYAQSKHGVIWQRELLTRYRTGKWTLLADADELLVLNASQTGSLPELLRHPALTQADAVRIFQLDIYPKGSLSETDFSDNTPFDQARFIDQVPLLQNSLSRGPYSNAPTWTSAVRHRLIPDARADLFVAQKVALVKYSPFMRFSTGLHYACGGHLAPHSLFFGHFKYHAQFHKKIVTEAARGQHFNHGEEYRAYLKINKAGRDQIYAPGLSIDWRDSPFVTARLSEWDRNSPK